MMGAHRACAMSWARSALTQNTMNATWEWGVQNEGGRARGKGANTAPNTANTGAVLRC